MIHSISGTVKMALVSITVLSSPKVILFAIYLTVDLILLTICSSFFFLFLLFCMPFIIWHLPARKHCSDATGNVCVPLEVSRAKPDPSQSLVAPNPFKAQPFMSVSVLLSSLILTVVMSSLWSARNITLI